jgi:hypothetical protein
MFQQRFLNSNELSYVSACLTLVMIHSTSLMLRYNPVVGTHDLLLAYMSNSPRLYIWEGDTYRIDNTAPAGSRVLVKVGDDFVSKPSLGILATTIEFEGRRVSEDTVLPPYIRTVRRLCSREDNTDDKNI